MSGHHGLSGGLRIGAQSSVHCRVVRNVPRFSLSFRLTAAVMDDPGLSASFSRFEGAQGLTHVYEGVKTQDIFIRIKVETDSCQAQKFRSHV